MRTDFSIFPDPEKCVIPGIRRNMEFEAIIRLSFEAEHTEECGDNNSPEVSDAPIAME